MSESTVSKLSKRIHYGSFSWWSVQFVHVYCPKTVVFLASQKTVAKTVFKP